MYTAEVDVHFPQLTVGQTLSFAAESRAPRQIPDGISRKEWGIVLRDVVCAIFGICEYACFENCNISTNSSPQPIL